MKDPRIDAYIAKSQPFARPILNHLRALVHKACPEVTETIKWGAPSFEYKGPYAMMSAFKAHAAFGFWKASLLSDPKGYLSRESRGSLGKITDRKDLPPDAVILALLKQAKKLNEEGTKMAKPKAAQKKLTVPKDLKDALQKNKKAAAHFEAFAYSTKKDYIEWLTEAKTETTRRKRLATAVKWIAEGKPRHWQYM